MCAARARAHQTMHACADINGGNTAVGTYELNTIDLCNCTGGTFVITAVFADDTGADGEYFGDSAGTTNITVLPKCPLVRPGSFCPSAWHFEHGHRAAHAHCMP